MEAIEAARGAIEVTAELFPYRSSEAGVPHAVLALTGVARCRRLLMGMVEFHSAHPDLVGGFARAHFEAWIWTMFLLLDGDEARRRLDANDVKEARRRAEDVLMVFSGANADPILEDARAILDGTTPSDTGAHMNLIDATKAVVSLLAARGERVPDFPRNMYAALYRGESTLSVHWGLQTANTHLATAEDGSVVVIAEPPPRDAADRRLELSTSGLLSIAREGANQLGLPTHRIVEFGRRWLGSTGFPTTPPGFEALTRTPDSTREPDPSPQPEID